MKDTVDIKKSLAIMKLTEHTSFPCPNCDKMAEVNTGIVLTSDPPQYSYYCPYCGSHGSISCSYVDQYQFNKKVWDVIEDADTHRAHCIICGEETLFTDKISDPYICENCKEAVIAMRKALGTWDD